MTRTTRAQRVSLFRLWERTAHIHNRVGYRQFRATVQPTFGMDGAVVVRWCDMWIAVETDGYTHS